MTALEVLMKGDVINGLSVWDWMDWMFAEKPTLNWISDVEPECLNGCAGGLVSSLLPHCVHARTHPHTYANGIHICMSESPEEEMNCDSFIQLDLQIAKFLCWIYEFQ